jgi:PAS domain S-box-containing protein
MNDTDKTAEQLIEELSRALGKIDELSRSLSMLERHKAALQKNEEIFRIYFELSNDIMFSYNNQLLVLYVSPNVERITGYKPEELIGKYFDDLQMLVPPDDVDEVMDNAQHYLSGNTVYPNIYRFITKDGTEKLAEVDGFPITHEGNVVAMVSLAKDITRHIEQEQSLRESEVKCRTTLQRMPDALCIIRMEDARYLYANDCFCKMTGFSSEEIIGQTIYDLNLPARHGDYDVLIGALKHAEELSGVELVCHKKDGTTLETIMSARPLHYDGEHVLVVVMTDVAALGKEKNEKKIGGIEAAEHQQREALQTLADGIAHDFKNILTAILGYTKMAGRDAAKVMKGNDDLSVVKNDLREVRNAAYRASELINQLLAFSQHTGKDHKPLLFDTVIRDCLNTVHSTLPENIKIKAHLSETGIVLGDSAQMNQVIANLCNNAARAMEETGGDLEVSLVKVIIDQDAVVPDLGLPAGPYVKLTISDTGHGMSPEVKRRIYDPYFTTRGKESGAGLGLSVAYGIVKSHGGVITCSSSPAHGTSFDIYLPLVTSQKAAAETLVRLTSETGPERILNLDKGLPRDQSAGKKKKGQPDSSARKNKPR